MQVRISKPTKSSMQSADGNNQWLLEFINQAHAKSKEPLMGRISSNDMSNQIKISFATRKEAIDFAEKKHYSYEIIEPEEAYVPKKNYASNFI